MGVGLRRWSTRKSSGPFRWVILVEICFHDDSSRSVKVKLQLPRQQCDSSELDPKVVLRPRHLPSAHPR